MCLTFTLLLWSLPGALAYIATPLSPLLAYSGDPAWKKKPEPMHEFEFRTLLDHLIWIVGMVYAYTFPTTSAWLSKLTAMENGTRKTVAHAGVALCAIAVMS